MEHQAEVIKENCRSISKSHRGVATRLAYIGLEADIVSVAYGSKTSKTTTGCASP